jgi:hypothetical protein
VAGRAAVQPQIEAGQVWLPRPRPIDGRLMRWTILWMTCAAFPKGSPDRLANPLTERSDQGWRATLKDASGHVIVATLPDGPPRSVRAALTAQVDAAN